MKAKLEEALKKLDQAAKEVADLVGDPNLEVRVESTRLLRKMELAFRTTRRGRVEAIEDPDTAICRVVGTVNDDEPCTGCGSPKRAGVPLVRMECGEALCVSCRAKHECYRVLVAGTLDTYKRAG